MERCSGCAPIVTQVCDPEVFQSSNFRGDTPQTTALQVKYTCSLGSSNLKHEMISVTNQTHKNDTDLNLSDDNVAVIHVL